MKTGGSAGQACSLLLVAAGGGAPQPQAVRRYARADLGVACAGRLTRRAQSSRSGELPRGKVGAVSAEGPLTLQEHLDQTRSEGWTGEERRIERKSSAKNVAPRPVGRLCCACRDGQNGNPGWKGKGGHSIGLPSAAASCVWRDSCVSSGEVVDSCRQWSQNGDPPYTVAGAGPECTFCRRYHIYEMNIGCQTTIWGAKIRNLEETLNAIRDAGYEGVEFHQRPENISERQANFSSQELEDLLGERGLTLLGLAGGSLRERLDFSESVKPMYLSIDHWDEQVAPAALEAGFTLAFHAHAYKPVQRVDQAQKVLTQNEQPRLKWIPDTGHLSVMNEDILAALRIVSPARIAAVHLKDWSPVYGRSCHRFSLGFTELGQGVVPLHAVLEELANIGFDGWIVVQQERSRLGASKSLFQNARWLEKQGLLNRPVLPANFDHLDVRDDPLPSSSTTTSLELEINQIKLSARNSPLTYQQIAATLAKLLRCRLVTVWACSEAHDLLSLLAVEPRVVPKVQSLGIKGSLTGIAVERQATTSFDLTSICPGTPYGRPDLSLAERDLAEQLDLITMISVPIPSSHNENHIRLVLNLFPADSISLSAGDYQRIAAQLAMVADSVLEEVCRYAAGNASQMAALATTPEAYATDLARLITLVTSCEGATVFLVKGVRLVAAGSTGIQWLSEDQFYLMGEGLTGQVWKDRGDKLSGNAIGEAGRMGKSIEKGSAPSSCLWTSLINPAKEVVGLVRCQNKRVESLGGWNMFSDDDLAVIDAVSQVALPNLQLFLAEQERRRSVRLLTHELKRPAAAVVAAADLMQRVLVKRKVQPTYLFKDDYIKDVHDWGELMLALIERASVYSQASAQLELEARPTNLQAQIVAPAVRQVSELLRSYGFSHRNIDYSGIATVPPLWLDKDRFQGVFFNLLSNSIKYSYRDPTVFNVIIGYDRTGDEFRIFVQDAGIGIPARFHSQVFREGERVQRPDHTRVAGLGLGLWVVDRILKAHGGRVKITGASQPTEVSLYLPRRLTFEPPERGMTGVSYAG